VSLFNVGFVIFPDLTQLDFTGPQQVLARLPQSAMHMVAKSIAPVPSDLSLVPTHACGTGTLFYKSAICIRVAGPPSRYPFIRHQRTQRSGNFNFCFFPQSRFLPDSDRIRILRDLSKLVSGVPELREAALFHPHPAVRPCGRAISDCVDGIRA
jgi:hypothetical protein